MGMRASKNIIGDIEGNNHMILSCSGVKILFQINGTQIRLTGILVGIVEIFKHSPISLVIQIIYIKLI
jgi:hypothetical protein